ncbi:MAG TPA: hypothetical protein VFL17_20000 [Anaerolineae bacterium]|nr:hypothetical protein [Anaerolineae bacterium]
MRKLANLRRLRITVLGLLAVMLIAACQGTAAREVPSTGVAPTASPTGPPTPVASPTPQPIPTPSPTPTVEPTPPPVVEQARTDLAGRLGRTVSDIEIRAVESRQWNDGCFEIPLPASSCFPISVPGYRVTLAVGDTEFEYHTDIDHRVAIAPTSSLMLYRLKYPLVWLEVRREIETEGFCDMWRVFEDGWGGWEAPCRRTGLTFYPSPERFHALREVVLISASFTEQIEDPYLMTGYLYGLGAEAPSDYARAVVRDFMRWLANPAGEEPPGTCTYTHPLYAYALDYPCNWEVEEETASFHSPGRGGPYAPPAAKISVYTTPPDPKPKAETPVPLTLADLEQRVLGELDESGVNIVERQEIVLNGQPAVRIATEDELGRYLTYLLVVNGRDYVLSGLGDLTAAEAVMRTFRVLSGP